MTADGLPDAGSRSTRSVPATACRTRRRSSRSRSRPSSSAAGRRRAAGRRGDQLRAPEVGAPARRRRGADDAARRRPARELPVLVPNERGLDRALELGVRHIAIFGSATETFAQRNLNRSLDEQFAMFEPTVKRARDAGLDVRAYVSMCFGDPWEGEVPVEQVVDGRQAAVRPRRHQLSLGDTIGVGTAGHVTALLDAFNAAGMADDQLAMHFHDTYGQALANAYSALPGRRHDVRRQRRRPRRLPVRRERHRQPRHRGPGLDAARPRHRDRRRPRRAGRDQRVDGRPARAARARPWSTPVVRALGCRGDRRSTALRSADRATHEPPSVYLHVGCAQDRHDVPPGPARAQRDPLAEHGVHYPAGPHGPDMFTSAPRSTCSTGPGAAAPAAPRRVGRAGPPGPPGAAGTAVVSHEILAARQARQVAAGDERPRGRRGARRLHRARPGPADRRRSGRRASSTGRTVRSSASSSRSGRRTREADLWFWRVQGLPDVLGPVGQRTPARAGAPGDRAAAGAPPERAVAALLPAFGIDPAWAPLDSEPPNASLGIAETQLLRRLNRGSGGRAPSEPVPPRWCASCVVQRDPGRAAADAAGDPAPGRLRLGRGGRRGVDRVGQGAGIDVVGDLEDLRPVRPPAGAVARPGPAGPRRQLRRHRRARRRHPRGRAPPRPRRHADLAGPPSGCATVTPRLDGAAAWAWVAHLRAGGTTPWRVVDVERRSDAVAGSCPAPSSSRCCAG